MSDRDFRFFTYAAVALGVVVLIAAGASSALIGAYIVAALVGVFVTAFRS